MSAPPDWAIKEALLVAGKSSCRSKRGVVAVYDGRCLGRGHNGPPAEFSCAGSCARGTCGQRSVHAEMRALRGINNAAIGKLELVHVELADDGGVVACGGPRCWQCSREILDCRFIDAVWLYERPRCTCATRDRIGRLVEPRVHAEDCWVCDGRGPASWRRYTAEEFHRATLRACGLESP